MGIHPIIAIKKIDRYDLILLLILAGALFVRIWGLNDYYYNGDEIQFIIIAKGETLKEVWRRGLAEMHPPLMQFIRHFILMLAPDVLAQRLVSVILGMISILGFYRVGLLLRGKSLGLFCALCMAFMPVTVTTSIVVRNYALMMAFLSWGLFFFLRYQQKEKTRDLLVCSALFFLACASHFSGFFVAGACGLCEGVYQLREGRIKKLLPLCVSFIPILLLGIFFAYFYMAPGRAGPIWHKLTIDTGFYSTAFTSKLYDTLLSVYFYFTPFLYLGDVNDLPIFIACLFVSGAWFLAFYIMGLRKVYECTPRLFYLIVIIWIVGVTSSLLGFYPFGSNRHNTYFLVFFILPFGYLLDSWITEILKHSHSIEYTAVILIAVVLFTENTGYYWHYYGTEFDLKQNDYDATQEFLNNHLQPGDIIVTGRLDAYHYLLFARDAGKTPYDYFQDVPYVHQSTIWAPYDTPFKPYRGWLAFRDDLASRLPEKSVLSTARVWFVMYGWKNTEIWHLMECKTAQQYIHDFFSRDGTVVFNMSVSELREFLKDPNAWQACYADYKPIIYGIAFESVKNPNP